jgi:hypothetical protein
MDHDTAPAKVLGDRYRLERSIGTDPSVVSQKQPVLFFAFLSAARYSRV